jgi:actin-like ATPase involved in cell morphogenesis
VGYVLGIDLGTAYTAAAVLRDGRVDIVGLGNHTAAIPSVVFLRDDGGLLIGDAAERRGVQEPARMAREFKRRFGDTAPIMLDRTPFSADRLFTVLLQQVLADVSQREGGAPDRIAVAHPANWGGFKTDLLRQAVTAAGVANATYVTEPVAVAVQYAATERVAEGDVVAVYDLGGGTFDAAVLRKTATGFEPLGEPQGIERLGGIDLDHAVLTHVRNALGGNVADLDSADPTVRSAVAQLRQECVAAKETLSSDSEATVSVLLPNVHTQVRITRPEFEDMIRPLVRETVAALRRAIDSAGVPLAGVRAVLLAGGSSRIPMIAEMITAELGRPAVSDSHPKHAVALGAARMAAVGLVPVTPIVAAPVVPPPAPPVVAPTFVPPAPAAVPPPMAQPAPPAPVRRRPLWPVLAGLIGVAVVVGGIFAFAGGNDESAGDTTVAATDATVSESTLAAPTTTVAGTDAPTTVPATNPPTTPAAVLGPADAVPASGASGWTMGASPAWTAFDIPNVPEEAAWYTGGGTATFASNINVITESAPTVADMSAYLQLSQANLLAAIPSATVIATSVIGEQGRFEYIADFGSGDQYSLAYIVRVNGVFVIATYSASVDVAPGEVPTVEPYLSTLRTA